MKIIPILIATLALPLMALGQDQSQADQGKKQEQQEQGPAKKKRAHPGQEAAKAPAKAETNAKMHQPTRTDGHAKNAMKAGAETTSTKTHTKMNKEQFRSSHTEVFNLGRHPKEFFVQRYGANHFRLIGNTYFVFVDGCWVAVDVAGFTFVQRVVCEGDPDYIIIY